MGGGGFASVSDAVGGGEGLGICDGAGAGAGLYFTGDSFSRKARRSGSRSRRGSLSLDGVAEEEPENQPMAQLELPFRLRDNGY